MRGLHRPLCRSVWSSHEVRGGNKPC